MNKLEQAKDILEKIGMPKAQQADLCAYTLLALLNIKEKSKWNAASNEYIRIHDIMEFIKQNYGVTYAENSRETFRKQAMHHFRIAALIEDNLKATNSPNYRYRITIEALNLIKRYGTNDWNKELTKYLVEECKNKRRDVNTYNSAIRFMYGTTLNKVLNLKRIPLFKIKKNKPDKFLISSLL